jgi:pimeloyl-ACP methyl ester carboxylesterase
MSPSSASEEVAVTPELTFSRLAGGTGSPQLLVVGPSLGTAVTALWGECAALLDDRFEVVGWDLPGHGSSPAATGPFSVPALAAVVRDRAVALAAGRPAAYAGVSVGGTLAFELADDPGPFTAVVSIASAPRLGDPRAWRERAALVRRAGTPVMVAPSAGRWFAPGFADRSPAVASALLTALSRADRDSYAWACEALADLDPSTEVRPTVVPLLVVAGALDVVVPPEVAEAGARSYAGASYRVLPGCGHLPPAEDPAATAEILDRALMDEDAA